MLGILPFRVRLVRPGPIGRIATPSPWNWSHRRVLLAGALAIAAATAPLLPAAAASSQSTSVTVNTVIMSLTVTPGAVTTGNCSLGNSTLMQLGFPNGECDAPTDANANVGRITITNTGGSGHIQVQGTDAAPAAGTGNWTLCSTGTGSTAPACTGPSNVFPATDQYTMTTVHPLGPGIAGSSGTDLANTPQCDRAINGLGTADPCALAAGVSASEFLAITGPVRSTNPAGTFTMTVTWVIVL